MMTCKAHKAYKIFRPSGKTLVIVSSGIPKALLRSSFGLQKV